MLMARASWKFSLLGGGEGAWGEAPFGGIKSGTSVGNNGVGFLFLCVCGGGGRVFHVKTGLHEVLVVLH